MDWKCMLVLAFGLAHSQGNLDRAYSPDHEYVYAYEAQLATGMPMGSKLYSGLKVKSDIRFQFKTVSRVTMKMEKIRLYKLNDIVNDEDPTREQLSVYEELTGTEAKWMGEYLMKPIMFKYIKGHVSEVKSEKDEFFWSLNVKLGVLSMMEMNFEERRSMDSTDRTVQISRDTYSPSYFYTVMEPSVVGDCETTYKLETDVPNDGEKYMYLTKVRNYKKCLDRPVYTRSIFNAMRCAECEKDRTEPFKSGCQIRYVMKGDKRRFMIQSAISESHHVFTPYSNEGGHVTTYINQTFVLINQESIKTVIPGPRNPEVHSKGLQADLQDEKDKPWKPLTAEHPLVKDFSPKRTPGETKQVIMEIIDMVYTNSKDEVKERATTLIFALMDQLRHAEPAVLQAVWNQYDVRDEPHTKNEDYHKYNKRKILLDLLPMTGTPAAVKVLAEYIMKTKIKPWEAAITLNSLTVTAYSDINIAKYLLEMVRDNYVRNTDPIRSSAYLCLGAVADRIRNEKDKLLKQLEHKEKQIKLIKEREHRKPVRDQLESRLVDVHDKMEQTTSIFSKLKHDIMKEVRTLFTTQKPEDYIMALKTIGNAGYPEFIPDCKSIMEDKSKPQMIRTQAIYSMRKIATYSPETVRTLLLPYYFNPQEPEEVRIASYLLIASTNPPRPMLEMIAQSLYREYNPHVGTFVYTHLEQLSNTTHPCLMSWAKNATFALQFAKKFSPSFHYSRFMHHSMYNDNMKMGGALEMGYISSPEEFIPRSGAVHGNMHILGYSTNVMEVGFNTEGIQKLANKLIGPGSKQTILDLLKMKRSNKEENRIKQSFQEDNLPKSDESYGSVKDVHDKLKVEPRMSPDPRGHVYFKMFNNEVRYFNLDESIFKKIVETGQIPMPMSENELKQGQDINLYTSTMFMQEQYSWFTEIGFPIHFKFKGSTTYKMTGSWKFEFTPRQNGRMYQATFDVNPSMAFQMMGIMEADFYYYKSGAALISKLQAGTPLSFTVTADTNSGKYSTKMNFKNLKEHFMHTDMRPTFYVEKYYTDISKERTTDAKYIDNMEGTSMTPVNWEYGKHELGLTFGVKGQIAHRNFLRRLPYYPFYGRNTIYCTVSPGLNPPEMGEFQFKFTNKFTSPSSSEEREEKQSGPFNQEQPMSVESQQPHGKYGEKSKEEKSSDKGLVSGFMSYLWGNSEDNKKSKEAYRQESREPNIESSDEYSHQTYKQDSRKRQQDQPTFPRYGFVMKFIGVGSKPERWFHFEGLYRKEAEKKEHNFEFQYMRTPFPETETSPYNVDMKGTLMFPTMNVEPSSLLDLSYQKDIQRLIKLYMQEDGEEDAVNQILQVQYRQRDTEALYRISSPAQGKRNLKSLVEELVHENEKSPDKKIQELIKLIKQQKKVSRHLIKIKKQRHSVFDASSKLQKVKDLVDQLFFISDEVSKQFEPRPQDPKKEVLVKVVVLRQQYNQLRLENIAKYLSGSLDRQQKQDLSNRLERNEQKVQKILQLQSDGEQQYRKILVRPDQRIPREVQELRLLQAKILKDVSSHSPTVRTSQVKQLLKKTEALLQQVTSQQPSSDNPDKMVLHLLGVVIQQKQILTALTQLRKPRDSLDDSTLDMSKESKDTELKKLVNQLEEQSCAVALLVQMKKDEKELKLMQEQESQEDIQTVKDISKVRLEQLLIAVSIPKSEKLEKEKALDFIRKLKDISKKVAEKAEDVELYSPIVQHIKSLCEVQIQLLDTIKMSVLEKLDPKQAQNLQNDKVINLDIINRLMERVKISSERSASRDKLTVNKLMSEIQLNQRAIRVLEKRQKERRERNSQHIVDISEQVVLKVKQVVDLVSKETRPYEHKEHLNKLKELVKIQDRILKSVKRELKTEVPSPPERLESTIQRQQRELQDLKMKIDRKIPMPVNGSYRERRPSLHRHEPTFDSSEALSQVQSLLQDMRWQSQRMKEVSSSDLDKIETKLDISIDFVKDAESAVHILSPKSALSSSFKECLRDMSELLRVHVDSIERLMRWVRTQDSMPLRNQLSEVRKVKSAVDELCESRQTSSGDSDEISSLEKKFPEDIKQEFDNQMFMNVDVTFGYKGLRSKMINIQMVSKKSMSQLQWEAKQISPRKDELVERYLEEKDEHGSQIRDAYRELKQELNMFRHYHWKVKYNKEDFEPYYRMMFWRFQQFVKYTFYHHAEFEMPKEMSDMWDVVFDIRQNDRQADLTVSTPLEWNKFWAVNFPWMYWVDFFCRMDSVRVPTYVPVKSPLFSVSKKLPGVCELGERYLKTFDWHVMELPDFSPCDVVLTMDCSPSAKFYVKVRSNKDTKKRVISLMVEKKRVEVFKDDRPMVKAQWVKVDNVPQTLSDDRPIVVYRESAEKGERQVLVEVSKHGQFMKISLPTEGVYLTVSDEKVEVKATPFYYSKLCGLCGNYDGIPRNDMENPERLKHKAISCLVADYIQPNDQCDAKPIKQQCLKDQPKSPEDCRPQERTMVKSRHHRGKSQVCFSKYPIKECKPGCKDVRPKGKLVPMKCLDQDHNQVEILLSQSHHRPLNELLSISVPQDNEIKTYFKEPYSCSRN